MVRWHEMIASCHLSVRVQTKTWWLQVNEGAAVGAIARLAIGPEGRDAESASRRAHSTRQQRVSLIHHVLDSNSHQPLRSMCSPREYTMQWLQDDTVLYSRASEAGVYALPASFDADPMTSREPGLEEAQRYL